MKKTPSQNANEKNKEKRWDNYFKKTKDSPVRVHLVSALPYITEKKMALDLGAGNLRDTKFLLESGFEKVVAVDAEDIIEVAASSLNDDRLETRVSRFEEFDFKDNTFDLINAQYSLPFIGKEDFKEVVQKIKNSIKVGGIFTGTFFGEKHSWNTDDRKLNFQLREEVEALFSDLEVLEISEKAQDKLSANGKMTHWHTFNVIAKKNA